MKEEFFFSFLESDSKVNELASFLMQMIKNSKHSLI